MFCSSGDQPKAGFDDLGGVLKQGLVVATALKLSASIKLQSVVGISVEKAEK